MHLVPAALPLSIPGMLELMEIWMQHAAHPGLHFIGPPRLRLAVEHNAFASFCFS